MMDLRSTTKKFEETSFAAIAEAKAPTYSFLQLFAA
jgi:16S rRNA G966 N2-methylase RsmD